MGRLACLVVSAASTLTTMYYVIRTIDPTGMDPPKTRITWVNQSVHVLNTVVAWCDILFSAPRDFSVKDRILIVTYTVLYSSWLLFVKFMTDAFPYPFLNKLPAMVGWFVVCLIGSVFMLFYFALGKLLKTIFRRISEPVGKDVTS